MFAPETFLPGRPAINRGVSGQPTPQLLWRFRQDALDLHPQTIVLLAGTNDIVLPGLRVQPSESRENITRMVEMARRRGIRVVLCSLPPVGFSDRRLRV
jgi:lysophospholipase L1-like esterase